MVVKALAEDAWMSQPHEAPKSLMQRILDVVERVGNKVPHPVIIFLILIGIVLVLSHVLYITGASVSYEAIVPATPEGEAKIAKATALYDTGTEVLYQAIDDKDFKVETLTVGPHSLLTAEGLRFIYSSLIPNFMS